ncbi:hypothetical protein COCCADRAFT_111743 [Bipolaris zeicola 26-R-13]|uniref:F-box domain-containing protein n=1 Tax=Cochliobolus carbonum (strain 26-R-13) TaxID=930089 RepID=W6XPH5_COCC2|nr:uncharacterized protein COCCADRAFT_111743 [Bipolaris zeicola 26-R-13]EUC27423.1 hypothetical protein COCCADRAFT_111743 [Bipolaris zeicola 26-R-13]
MDMAIARIRTPDEPPTAAWDYTGCNYVGFDVVRDFYGEIVEDHSCQQCTTADRTPAVFQHDPSDGYRDRPEDQEDAEWLPDDNSCADSEPLEYDTDADVGPDDLSGSNDCDTADKNRATYRSAVRELYQPPLKGYPPHGTWDVDGRYLYTRDRRFQYLKDRLQDQEHGPPRFPLEHIASPTCQSVQGINGNKLSVAEMKGCRNHRFLLPRPSHWVPPDWKPEAVDGIFEKDSLFVLSGEANGSYASMAGQFVYPPRYGLDRVPVSADTANQDCWDCGSWQPLPVHSYCLDIYAKASYRRLGRVDLHDIWLWRELCGNPARFEFADELSSPYPGIGRANEIDPFLHHVDNEWMVANPVEIPGLAEALKDCLISGTSGAVVQKIQSPLLELPAELLDNIFVFLNDLSVDAIAATCRTFRRHAQPLYRRRVTRDMSWLWEVLEGRPYPASPDWPVTWDPCNPPGLVPPELPLELKARKEEAEIWAQIIADDPNMSDVGSAAQLVNFIRREAILGSYRAKLDCSLHEWQNFRTEAEGWICSLPPNGHQHTEDIDWVHLWHSFTSEKTLLPGIRNRVRIWRECERIASFIYRLRDSKKWGKSKELDREIMDDVNNPWWEEAFGAMQDMLHVGFLRKREWEFNSAEEDL